MTANLMTHDSRNVPCWRAAFEQSRAKSNRSGKRWGRFEFTNWSLLLETLRNAVEGVACCHVPFRNLDIHLHY